MENDDVSTRLRLTAYNFWRRHAVLTRISRNTSVSKSCFTHGDFCMLQVEIARLKNLLNEKENELLEKHHAPGKHGEDALPPVPLEPCEAACNDRERNLH